MKSYLFSDNEEIWGDESGGVLRCRFETEPPPGSIVEAVDLFFSL